MKKLHFGCGSNRLLGWDNYDYELDITKPLPFEGNTIDFIFNEHLIEHVTQQEAYLFLKDCYRILKINGVLKIITPDLEKIYKQYDDSYIDFLIKNNFTNELEKDPIKAIIFNHGHKCVYTSNALSTMMKMVGFEVKETTLDDSTIPELINTHGHHKVIGKKFNDIESIVLIGVKKC